MKTRLVGVVAVCAAAGVLASAGTWLWLSGGARDGAAVASAPVASAQAPAAQDGSSKDGVLRNGIGVRGHWVIEIRNPDGSLDRRQEFDNQLLNQGSALGNLLTTYRSLWAWKVQLTASPQLFLHEAGPNGQPEGTQNGSIAYTLKAQWQDVGLDATAYAVRLTGRITAPSDLKTGGVITYLLFCAQETCTPAEVVDSMLTQHSHPEQISVLKDQQILVTVDISFQTAS